MALTRLARLSAVAALGAGVLTGPLAADAAPASALVADPVAARPVAARPGRRPHAGGACRPRPRGSRSSSRSWWRTTRSTRCAPRCPTSTGSPRRTPTPRDYTAIRHPSLPNYLAIASGSTHGVTDDGDPSAHQLRGRTVFDQAIARRPDRQDLRRCHDLATAS